MTANAWHAPGRSPLVRATPVELAQVFLRRRLGDAGADAAVTPVVEALGVPGIFPFRVSAGGHDVVRLVGLQPDGTLVAPPPSPDVVAEPDDPRIAERLREALHAHRDEWFADEPKEPALPLPQWIVDTFYLLELERQSYLVFATFDRAHRLLGLVVGPGMGSIERGMAETPVIVPHPPAIGRYAIHAAGDSPLDNPHHVSRGQRYGMDFIPLDAGSTRVVSPVDGIVEEAVDGWPDDAAADELVRDDHPYGNLVKVWDGARSYWFVHLRRSSVTVRAGDRVRAGGTIGHVGNSGRTAEPHLHFAVSVRGAVEHGVPIRFLSGGETVELRRGDAIDTSGYDFGLAAGGASGTAT